MILPIGNKKNALGLMVQGVKSSKKPASHFFAFNHNALNFEKGLTLIEVLIAVSILSFGVAGVLQAYAHSISALEAGQYNVDAVNLMKEKMADVEQALIEQPSDYATQASGTVEDFKWEWEIKPTKTENLNELTLRISNAYNLRIYSIKSYVVDPEEE